MLWRALRTAFWVALGVALFQLAAPAGKRTLWIASGALLAIWAVAYSWLPRGAHRAFRRGLPGRARLLYRVIVWLSFVPERRAEGRLSIGATYLIEGRFRDGLRHLAQTNAEVLAVPARAALLNNRAYALLRSGGDTAHALADAEAAIALRPDVPGFRHTRALAYLRVGRIEEAIRELEDLWSAADAEARPLLESERCFDLAQAWQQKGEPAYAGDYLERARRAAPTSYAAGLAVGQLHGREPRDLPSALGELL